MKKENKRFQETKKGNLTSAAAESQRFQFGSLAHLFCQPPEESIFFLSVLAFVYQSVSFCAHFTLEDLNRVLKRILKDRCLTMSDSKLQSFESQSK